MMHDALHVRGLAGGYGPLRVFRDVSFSLSPNEILGISGPNGAGKTTLLKVLIGLLGAQEGYVSWGNMIISKWPAYIRARHGITMVMEGRQIFNSLSVSDNLLMARSGAPREMTKLEFEAELERILGLFPRLAERKGQLGGSLSGGEQQMLAIARALVTKPKIIMLDEPTQGLAPVIILDLVQAIHRMRTLHSVILVEQNRSVLDQLADRVLVMRSGRLSE